MRDFVVALGLVFVIEGVLYALFPAGMQRMITATLTQPPQVLRACGLAAALIGFGIVWLIRG